MPGGPPPLEPREQPAVTGGQMIAGRFRVEHLLARGGMAAVYVAEQVALRRRVALKVLVPPGGPEDQESFEDRFRLEAETLASLDHPNIVILHDYGHTDTGGYFLAMEYVEGPRFSDLLKDGAIPAPRALDLILQVCAALRYAHKRGVIHRDLKPSNLLVRVRDDGAEQVKVVDFGLVRLTDQQGITKSGMILGSPHCMAPEQVRGEDVDARTDIYSIGILLFRSITGHYPFHGPTSAATMIAHLTEPLPTFFSVAPDLQVPAGLEAVVRRCLARDPAERFPDSGALVSALEECRKVPAARFESVDVSHTTLTRKLEQEANRERWRRYLPGILVGAAVAAVALFGAKLVGLTGPGTPPPVAEIQALQEAPEGPNPAAEPVEPEVTPEAVEATPEEAETSEERQEEPSVAESAPLPPRPEPLRPSAGAAPPPEEASAPEGSEEEPADLMPNPYK